ncbi:MAG: hypothetical protein GX345_00440 [Clostridiales bacterium]|nr:hypothetical protein [Clostridiales bacterium]
MEKKNPFDFASKKRREILTHIDELTYKDTQGAKEFCLEMLEQYGQTEEISRAKSDLYAACLTVFLLHKKNKSKLTGLIFEEEAFRLAFFGRLNTYKHSIVFVLKRVLRENAPALTEEVLTLLLNNPFRDENSKPYSDRWGLKFLIDEAMKAPEDYLSLSRENLQLIERFKKILPENGE